MSKQLWAVVRAPSVARQGEIAEQPDHEIWVRSTDGVGELSTKLVEMLDERMFVDIACMGAHPTNVGVKAVAELRKNLHQTHQDHIEVICQPFFSSFIDESGEERTRVVLRVFLKAMDD